MNKILANKNLDSTINELIELIDAFSTKIYEKQNNECYKLLISIIDKLDSVVGTKVTLQIESNCNKYIKDLTHKLPYLLDAFENNDNVLISDILKYETKPLLEKLTKMCMN